jgi:hypothetical protein
VLLAAVLRAWVEVFARPNSPWSAFAFEASIPDGAHVLVIARIPGQRHIGAAFVRVAAVRGAQVVVVTVVPVVARLADAVPTLIAMGARIAVLAPHLVVGDVLASEQLIAGVIGAGIGVIAVGIRGARDTLPTHAGESRRTGIAACTAVGRVRRQVYADDLLPLEAGGQSEVTAIMACAGAAHAGLSRLTCMITLSAVEPVAIRVSASLAADRSGFTRTLAIPAGEPGVHVAGLIAHAAVVVVDQGVDTVVATPGESRRAIALGRAAGPGEQCDNQYDNQWAQPEAHPEITH